MDENEENNNNINNALNNDFNISDIDNTSNLSNENLKSNVNNNKDINQYFNEDVIPYSPELLDEPIPPSHTRKLISEEIKGKKEVNNDEEEIFTFKIKKENNNKFVEKNKNIKKYRTDNNLKKEKNNRIDNNKIKANVLTFDELISRNNNEKLKKKNVLKENNDNSQNKKNSKKKIKIDFSRKLYQNKTIYGHPEDIKKNKLIKENNKSEKNLNKKIPNINKNKLNKVIMNKIKKINNEKDKNLINYFKINNSSNKKPNDASNINIQNKKRNVIMNLKEINDNRTNKSYLLNNISMEKDNSFLMNKSNITSRSKRKLKLFNPMDNRYKLALKNREYRHSQKRHTEINDELYNFDNSKFEKYDTEQMRYNLIKDFSFIHPEKNNNFLERMKFDALQRKNKENKLNELLEKNKNKYKLNEKDRKKTFNRLIDDANRRLIMKQELIENEKYLTDYKDVLDNSKKYNQDEWEKIYRKRFKEYEDIKKKKLDIQRQNEKIKKMLKEEQEINMCKIVKIPKNKIKENTDRLFNDYKKREILRNNGFYKNSNNNICLTNVEEDASKYIKNYKNVEYTFYDDNNNINNLSNINNSNLLRNNKSFNRKRRLKKNSKISVTEFNDMRFNTRNEEDIYNNYNKNNYNVIEPYFNYKRNKVQSSKNNYVPTPTIPYEYNYNNYNIYNINNLNNNINSAHNLNNLKNINNNNDDNYLDNITYKLMQSAALNKINSERTNDNRMIHDNLNRNINYNSNNNRNLYINNNYGMNNNDYMNKSSNLMPQSEGNQLIEQFFANQLGFLN